MFTPFIYKKKTDINKQKGKIYLAEAELLEALEDEPPASCFIGDVVTIQNGDMSKFKFENKTRWRPIWKRRKKNNYITYNQ